MDITTIFFDIGGVMFGDVEAPNYHKLVDRFGVPFERLWEARYDPWQKFKIGAITEGEYWEEVFDNAKVENTKENAAWASSQMYIEPLKDNWKCVPKLKGNGYQLGIISNHAKEWVDSFMDFDNFRDNFDPIIFSYEVSCVKPNPKIYQIALERAGVNPEQSLFIDDKQKNIEAAQSLGMHGFVYEKGTNIEQKLLEFAIRL